MLPVLIIVLLILVILLPQLWVKTVLKKYDVPLDSMPGTGAELVTHLQRRFNIEHLDIEVAEQDNDHYDPITRTIRLADRNYHGTSLTAITVAAHEFGHALQHHTNYPPLALRSKLAQFAFHAQRIASILLLCLPFSFILVKVPLFSLAMLLSGMTIMLLPVIIHLVTLPVEFDASFNRALPLLENEQYLPASAMPIARKILTAAALTYVAGSLMSLLNFYRWIAILRR